MSMNDTRLDRGSMPGDHIPVFRCDFRAFRRAFRRAGGRGRTTFAGAAAAFAARMASDSFLVNPARGPFRSISSLPHTMRNRTRWPSAGEVVGDSFLGPLNRRVQPRVGGWDWRAGGSARTDATAVRTPTRVTQVFSMGRSPGLACGNLTGCPIRAQGISANDNPIVGFGDLSDRRVPASDK